MSESDDERARGREAILKRRAKLVAYAVAAGVAMPACGGKSDYCLSILAPDGGKSSGGTSATGGTGYCLSIAGGNTFGGYGATSVCLGMPYDGGETYCLSGGGPPEGGMAGEAGLGGVGGEPPIFCLSAPLAGAPPVVGGAGESGEGSGGQGGAG